ncbi:MAG: sulfur carrier protein ThiS [Akkermansiaceae bacterium]|nr:sulfur carrier protein ThiS [Akkermansiaceae bacterium]
MKITINGKDQDLDAPASITSLLATLGLADKPVVVELNKKALFPREYTSSQLEDGDQVEIIAIAAGG